MSRTTDIALTAIAPAIWGSSYIVTTQFLPAHSPFVVALLRALPAGLLLMLLVRQLPPRAWIAQLLILGALNFAVFWSLLFVAAYRLPGGVAATVGAVQPLIVVFLSAVALGTQIRLGAVLSALGGIVGVALLLLGPEARLDWVGVLAGLGGALSMAVGVVLTRKWRPDVPLVTFTAWQLTAGGLLMIPVAWLAAPDWPGLSLINLAALTWLSLIGGALTYILWFRGLARIEPAAVSLLGILSPLTAVILGWLALGESLSPVQGLGAIIVLGAVWIGQRPADAPRRLRFAQPRCGAKAATTRS
ncbi:EamA family transporter [Ruegeria pomeroyi]|nr:EamA family transporter [Ruegeria pomeroyi]